MILCCVEFYLSQPLSERFMQLEFRLVPLCLLHTALKERDGQISQTHIALHTVQHFNHLQVTNTMGVDTSIYRTQALWNVWEGPCVSHTLRHTEAELEGRGAQTPFIMPTWSMYLSVYTLYGVNLKCWPWLEFFVTQNQKFFSCFLNIAIIFCRNQV